MRLLLIYTLIVTTVISCYQSNEPEYLSKFVIPQINNSKYLDSTITFRKFEVDHVNGVFSPFMGKYRFATEIDIGVVDTSIYQDFIHRIPYDSVEVNGLELIVDYDQTVLYNKYYKYDKELYEYYPVYFVNSTNTDKILMGYGDYLHGIQEAKDKENNWLPIESQGWDLCYTGMWGITIHPEEFVVVLMKKYKGDFSTELRVRYENGNSIYVSKSFLGEIDENQFRIPNDSSLKRKLLESNGRAAKWLLYGAEVNDEIWE